MVVYFFAQLRSGLFWSILQDIIGQKMTGSQKVFSVKKSVFLLVNHAKEFLKSVQTESLFSALFV